LVPSQHNLAPSRQLSALDLTIRAQLDLSLQSG
jgi:hypothetical protein